MSGHSKWANIKNKKGAEDKKRSETFTKVSKNILTALRTGGSIKVAVDRAREVNMPKENIERLIERFESRKANLKNYLLEGYGPCGIPIMVEIESDNKNRILGEVRLIFKNRGGNLGEEGSVGFMFDRVGEIETGELTEENKLELIDVGAIDFEEGGVITEVINLNIVANKMVEMGLMVESSKIIMRVKTPITLKNEEELNQIMEMIEELEENDDVVAVFAGFNYNE